MLRDPIVFWLVSYLSVGLTALVLLRWLVAIRTKLEPVSAMLREIRREREGKDSPRVRWTRLAGKVLIFPLLLLIWPAVVVAVIHDMYFPARNP